MAVSLIFYSLSVHGLICETKASSLFKSAA